MQNLIKREFHILTKHIHTYTHTRTQTHKILQFPFINFLIFKLLHDSLIVNVESYFSLKV